MLAGAIEWTVLGSLGRPALAPIPPQAPGRRPRLGAMHRLLIAAGAAAAASMPLTAAALSTVIPAAGDLDEVWQRPPAAIEAAVLAPVPPRVQIGRAHV